MRDEGVGTLSTMLPYKKTTTAVVCLLLIDLPFFLAVAVIGWKYGYARTWRVATEYRTSHPWTFIPSIAMTVFLVRRWRRS